jgi:hypothetical protein
MQFSDGTVVDLVFPDDADTFLKPRVHRDATAGIR